MPRYKLRTLLILLATGLASVPAWAFMAVAFSPNPERILVTEFDPRGREPMLRFPLRTFLFFLAVLPPLLWIGWVKYQAWRAEQERQRMLADQPVLVDWLIDPIPADDLGMWFIEGKPIQSSLPEGRAEPPPDSSDLEHSKGQ